MTNNNLPSEENKSEHTSPKWSWTTKLVIGLALVALSVWLLVQFQNFLGPLISALILAYLLYPVAGFLQKKVKLPWRIAVTIIFIILVLAILGLLTWGGFTLVEQVQNLIRFIEKNIDQLPDLVENITEQTYQIGPFTFTPTGINWDQITSEIVGAIQPVLGQLGSLASSVAAGAANIISWLVIILLIAYFLLAESEGIPSQLLNIKIKDYTQDVEHMGNELNRIWNAFMRGEILVVLMSLIIYTVTLGVLGIQFFFGLAVVAAVGQLIPYVGAWITWITIGLVALFQSDIPFGLAPGIYMIIVLGVSLLVNNIIDNILRTKVMAENLKVHPALVLIGALIGVQLFGFVGIVIAAPVMASFKLFLGYVIRKLSDQDPWKNLEVREPIEKPKWQRYIRKNWPKIKDWLSALWQKIKSAFVKLIQKITGAGPSPEEKPPRK